jgi:hypothetical protein
MTELDVARQIAAGEIDSPQKLGGMTLWAMRITGTGLSYRAGHDEFVWRDAAIYLNPEFLARCNGLPVIWWHPEKKPSLDSVEYKKRSIGTVMLPYLKNEEVWGICRVYDEEAIQKMTDGQLSTSPAVVFSPGDGNKKIELNGETFLIEGVPSLLDHVAVCDVGVWDVGGPPTGVQNDTLAKEQDMADETDAEKTEREDKARKDAEFMDRMDKWMTKADARMDAMEADKARKDAAEEEERKDRARHDAARKDRFGGRKDGESYKDWKNRHDADEAAMCDALEKGGVEKDRARKDARDCRADAEKEEGEKGGEAFAKWAKEEENEEAHKDKARKDAEEKERVEKEEQDRKDAARHDSQATTIADLQRQLAEQAAAIKQMTTEVPANERDALARAQARADSVAAMFGDRVRAPIPGETALAYRLAQLKRFQPHSEKFKESRLDSLDAATIDPIEDIIYADAVSAAKRPALARPGLLMEIVRPDAAGRQIKTYVGDPMAWMAPYMSQGASGRIRRNPNSNEGI